MNTLPEIGDEILPPNPIRVETALSRYPVHRLAKHGDIVINICLVDEHGEASIKWEVTHNSKYKQPGPLAYKVDTLIINRRIEEAVRPVPRMIKLGSLHDICRELGTSEGKNRDNIKQSLYQNASAFIKAQIRYKQNGGGEKSLEAGFTRYSVVLTGEELPDGRKADAVYIILNDIYMQIINGAMTRPLDYDYLKGLNPASQRFYELLSYQMYAAIKNDRPRAKLVYSEFCTYAPLVRQFDWDVVRPQLARIHAPHKKSGYIADITYEQTVDADGQPDWIMFYQPGPKARAEFRAFAKRGGPVMLQAESFTADPPPQLAAPEPPPLEAELIGRGITAGVAAALVRDHGEEKIRAQGEILDWYLAKKPGKIADPAAWWVSAIRSPTGHAAPKGFVSKAEQQRRAESQRQSDARAAEERRRKQAEETRQREKRREEDAYWSKLTPAARAELEARALAEADEASRETYLSMKRDGSGGGVLAVIRREYIRTLIDTEKLAGPPS